MCEFSSKLIAWIDGELPDDQMAAIDGHVTECNECRKEAAAFREVSRAFAVCSRTELRQPARAWRAAVLVPAAIAAAAVLAALLTLPRQAHEANRHQAPAGVAGVPLDKLVATAAPPTVPARMAATRPRRAKRAPRQPEWAPAEPTIQILIPADALFPPGALPEGVDLVANLRFAAEGSPASLALRP